MNEIIMTKQQPFQVQQQINKLLSKHNFIFYAATR